MTNYDKEKIDNSQKNSKSRFCWERDEMIIYIVSKRHKLAQNKF